MKKDLIIVDLGTNNVRVASARYIRKSNANKIKVQEFKCRASRGLKYEKVINFKDIEDSILETIFSLSDSAQKRIRSVIIALPPWVVNSQIVEISNNINQNLVDTDLILSMKNSCISKDEEIIHIIPIDYSLDGISGIKDPRGMKGKNLSAIFHTLSVKKELLDSLRSCLRINNINVQTFVSAPIMSSLVLTQNIKSEATVIDIGGSCTSITCVNNDGVVVYSKNIPIGSEVITQDISTVFKIDMASAERIKILYGLSKDVSNNLDIDPLLISAFDDFESKIVKPISRDTLSTVIVARLDELLECIRMHLLENEIDDNYYQTIFFTGGGSRLLGLEEYIKCKNFLTGASISVAKPTNIIGSDDNYVTSPSFSTIAGVVSYVFEQLPDNTNLMRKSLFDRIKSLFKGGI